jgi:superfamily I DNA/RNA helicase
VHREQHAAQDKDLWTENAQGAKAKLFSARTSTTRRSVVMQELKRLNEEQEIPWSRMAIFYRMNALSRVMEDALRRANIPYQIARGVEFYNRKEIKDVLAYLRVVANPLDEVSLTRIVNVPPRGIGDTTVKQMQAYAIANGMTLWDAMERVGQITGLSTRAVNATKQFSEQVRQWRSLAMGGVQRRPARGAEGARAARDGRRRPPQRHGGDAAEGQGGRRAGRRAAGERERIDQLRRGVRQGQRRGLAR